MEINALSRALYDDVPNGGFVFMVDKIGLRIRSCFLNKENLETWKVNNFITILTFGETAQINIHAEFSPSMKHLGRRCLNAVILLMNAGVFKQGFVIPFMATLNNLFPYIWFIDFLAYFALQLHFELAEWEWAYDFLDYKPYSHIETDKENPRTVKKYEDAYYSRDDKASRRLRENKDGKMLSLSKGRQKSLVIVGYDRGKKIGSERTVYRTEIRQQGKYKNGLSMDLLNGNQEDAFKKALPRLKKTLNKVLDTNTLVLSDHFKQNPPQQYVMLFSDEEDKK
jgi:hypothetical protein